MKNRFTTRTHTRTHARMHPHTHTHTHTHQRYEMLASATIYASYHWADNVYVVAPLRQQILVNARIKLTNKQTNKQTKQQLRNGPISLGCLLNPLPQSFFVCLFVCLFVCEREAWKRETQKRASNCNASSFLMPLS